MLQFSHDPLENLAAQIRVRSPHSPPLLQAMREECGRQAAYYAAFVLICLQATTESGFNKALGEYTSADFQDFAFFEVAKGNVRALEMFEELLLTYQHDRITAQI